jgi:hypothetical protein
MGLLKGSLVSMCYAAENGVRFTNTAMIGRQCILMTRQTAAKILKKYEGGGGMKTNTFLTPRIKSLRRTYCSNILEP